MRDRKSDHIFSAEASGPHDGVPSVDSTAGDEGIDDPDVSEIDFPTTTDVSGTGHSSE